MEEHFLKDFVSGPSGLPPEPWYNPDGDCIIYQTADEAVVADRLDEVVTIYRSAITGKALGYQIKGVAAIVKKFGLDGIAIETKEQGEELTEFSLHALLLAAYEGGPKTIRRRRAYAEAFQTVSQQSRVSIDDLASVVN